MYENGPWERDTTELSLNEELRVEQSGGGIERQTLDGRVNVVGSGDRVTKQWG